MVEFLFNDTSARVGHFCVVSQRRKKKGMKILVDQRKERNKGRKIVKKQTMPVQY